MYISKRRLRPKEKEAKGELNIVPYLDILMNLIIFMLLSMTGLVSYAVLNVASPKYGGGGAAASASAEPDKPKLMLTVLIGEEGFFVAGAGAVLGSEEGQGDAASDKAKPTIPKVKGEYNFAGLTAKMREIKSVFPNESKIILGADPRIEYETLVKTMDACREDGPRRLFYDVSLSVM